MKRKTGGLKVAPKKLKPVDVLRLAKIEETRQRSRVLRLQADREDKRLCDVDDVRVYFGRVLGSLRVQLSELGPNLAARVNPADPGMAAAVISDALNGILETASDQVADFLPVHRLGKTGTRPGEMVRAR